VLKIEGEMALAIILTLSPNNKINKNKDKNEKGK